MKEKDFDIAIREALADAKAPVSAGLWKKVCAGISAAAPKTVAGKAAAGKAAGKSVTLPFAGALAYVGAAAAALVAAILLFGPEKSPAEAPLTVITAEALDWVPSESVPAETIPEEAVPAETALAEAASSPVKPAETLAANRDTTLPASNHTEVASEEIFTEAPETEPQRSAATSAVQSSSQDSFSIEKDRLALAMLEIAAKKEKDSGRGFSVSIYGDVQNGGRPTFSRSGSFAPRAPQTPSGEGIYNEYPEARFSLPFTVGAGIKYYFSFRLAVGTGIKYSFFTRTFMGDYYDQDLFPYTGTDIDNTQRYIGIPVNVYFDVIKTKYWHAHVFGGGTAEFLLDNDYLVHSSPKDIHYHDSEKYPVQLSTGVGFGVEFNFSSRVSLYFDPSLRYFFATDKQPRSIRTIQPLRFDLEAGLRFKI